MMLQMTKVYLIVMLASDDLAFFKTVEQPQSTRLQHQPVNNYTTVQWCCVKKVVQEIFI